MKLVTTHEIQPFAAICSRRMDSLELSLEDIQAWAKAAKEDPDRFASYLENLACRFKEPKKPARN